MQKKINPKKLLEATIRFLTKGAANFVLKKFLIVNSKFTKVLIILCTSNSAKHEINFIPMFRTLLSQIYEKSQIIRIFEKTHFFKKTLIFRMSKRQKVQYAGMEEPKFLKAFKDKVDP